MLEELDFQCPYCGEPIVLEVEALQARQHLISDCEVCCRPIEFHVRFDEDGVPHAEARRGDD